MRWQKCVEYVNDRMGMAVGRMFIRDNFPKESKDVVSESKPHDRDLITLL